jgi:hypothetical protein
MPGTYGALLCVWDVALLCVCVCGMWCGMWVDRGAGWRAFGCSSPACCGIGRCTAKKGGKTPKKAEKAPAEGGAAPAASTATPAAAPAAGDKKGDKKAKAKKRRVETYSTYIYKVLKQVHPDTGISRRAMSVGGAPQLPSSASTSH